MARRAGGEEYRPAGLELLEAMAFRGARWWTIEDLAAHTGDGGQVIPGWLVEQLPKLLAGGSPPAVSADGPLDMGELPDFA